MRKLIMWNVITLDGYFEGNQNWELPFHEIIWGDELEQFSLQQLYAADYLIFGRITYEGMAAYWQQEKGEIAELMNNLPKVVASRTLTKADWNNTTLISQNIPQEIQKLKEGGEGDMYVFGSAILSRTLLQSDLFDEYRIAIAPVILGSGRPLFEEGLVKRNLDLTSIRKLKSDGIILNYGRKGS